MTETATCRAVDVLWERMDAGVFFGAFCHHLDECARCRSLLEGPALRRMAAAYLAGLGEPSGSEAPETALCLQVDYLTRTREPVDADSFARSYTAHILSCSRCMSLVPGRISPELLSRSLPPLRE